MTFKEFIGGGSSGIIGIINTIIVPLIFALTFVVFVWGVLTYFFFNQGDETKRAAGRQFALWGILGLVVMLGIWGLLNMLLSTLGIAPTR